MAAALAELLTCRYTARLSARIHELRCGMLVLKTDFLNAEVLPLTWPLKFRHSLSLNR